MKATSLRYFYIMCLVFICRASNGAGSFQVSPESGIQQVNSSISATWQELADARYQELNYQNQPHGDLNAGYKHLNQWIKIELENPSDNALERILFFTSARVGIVEMFDSVGTTGQINGGDVPFVKRSVKARLPAFKLQFTAHEKKTVFLKRNSHHSMSSQVQIADPQSFIETELEQKSFLYLYMGGILCLIIFNFLIGIYTSDSSVLYYSLFALTLASTIMVNYGVFDSYIFSNLDFALAHKLMCFSAMSILTSLIFVDRFLNLKIVLPTVRKTFKVLAILAVVVFVQGLLGDQAFFWNKMGFVTDILVVTTLLTLVGTAIVRVRQGDQIARFFLMSWAFMLVGVLGFFGVSYELLPRNTLFVNGLLFGNLGEMLVIALGLAFKIDILDQEKKQALRAAKEKDHYHRLVKVLSHDISNAMMMLSGYVMRLKRGMASSEDQPVIQKMSDTISKMNSILGMVRKEEAFKSFQQAIELESVDLGEVVQEALVVYEDSFIAKNLKINISIAENVRVFADRTALAHQVISNIISNSIKFSKSGGEISIYLSRQKDLVQLCIQDEGVGIPQHLIQKIFFSPRPVSTEGTMGEKGSGLGSSLIRDYMALFRGELFVESSTATDSVSKTGTKVILSFPVNSIEPQI